MLQQPISPRPLLIDRFATDSNSFGLRHYQELEQDKTDILLRSKTNFLVEKKPMYILDFAKEDAIPTEKYILGKKNNDKHFFNSVVSPRYQIIQNEDMLEVALVLVDGFNNLSSFTKFEYISAGKSPDDSIVYYTFGVTDIMIPVVGKSNYYLVVVADHNKMSCKIMFTPIRMVCHNQLAVGYRSAAWSLSVPHRGSTHITKLIAKFNKFFSDAVSSLNHSWEQMSQMELPYDQYKVMVRGMLELPANADRRDQDISTQKRKAMVNLDAVYDKGIGQSELPNNTLAKAVNAITCYEANYAKNEDKLREYFNPSLSGKFFKQLNSLKQLNKI